MKYFIIISITVLCAASSLIASVNNSIRIDVDASKQISTVPDLYSVGYNGWGDILYPSAVKHLKNVDVKYCRIIAQLNELCGDAPGDYRWEYVTPADLNVGFISRVKKIISNGWTPIIAFSLHGGLSDLPKWFHGENNDLNSKAWFRYDLDGTLSSDGIGDQYMALEKIAADTVKKLASEGLKGLHWETIYEMGHDMPLAEIHYYAAKGIRKADPSAFIIGPATWPGWTVEERFVKPFLSKYDVDLLDYVSVHWYGSNDHGLYDLGFKPETDIITMNDRKYLDYLLEKTTDFAKWTLTLRKMLDDPKLNPKAKDIGIMYTEFDAVAQSPYQKNPKNPVWPKYDPASDCYINTNYFGGVWCGSVLCNFAAFGKADVVLKFNTRSYYGLIENGKNKNYFRQPVWFAWKLLQQTGGLKKGALMVDAKAESPSPVLETFAVKSDSGVNLIIINKSWNSYLLDVFVSGTKSIAKSAERYEFSKNTTAAFIGPKPGTTVEGVFEGAPLSDSINYASLKAGKKINASEYDGKSMINDIDCPPISIVVLKIK